MRRVLILMLALLLSASGCSEGEGTRSRTAASATPRPRPLKSVARSSTDVDPVFHIGQQIFITNEGFKPKQLIAIVAEEIRWINETDETVAVRLSTGGFESGPIEPGESATYTPGGALSLVYELAGHPDVKGAIQVEPYFDPGEDPAAEDRFDADTPRPSRRTGN